MVPFQNDGKNVDCDVKPQHKQILKIAFICCLIFLAHLSSGVRCRRRRYRRQQFQTLSETAWPIKAKFLVEHAHTVYPVTPNAGMFYQRGYKHLRRGNTQGKKTCNSRISIIPISNITFQTLCKRAFLRDNGASKR